MRSACPSDCWPWEWEVQRGVLARRSRGRSGRALRWRRPRLVFVNSMSDLFHKRVPAMFIETVFDGHEPRIAAYLPGTHQTAGSGRAARPQATLDTEHLARNQHRVERWLGRLARLRDTDAHTKFLSLEPLLGPLLGIPLQRSTGSLSWRIRTRRTANGHRLGAGHPRQLPAKRSTVSSSNGAVYSRRRRAGHWIAESGIRCPNQR